MAGYIRQFKDITIAEVPLVGGKNASLGEMINLGINVPDGFAITIHAYRAVLNQGTVLKDIHAILDDFDVRANINQLHDKSKQTRDIILAAGLPGYLKKEILQASEDLQKQYDTEISMAVRSSSTIEDTKETSFAGVHDSFLNIKHGEELLDYCLQCFASMFTPRAIYYREILELDHYAPTMSVCVMKMVRADLAASGVMLTDEMHIAAAYGLCEPIVQGVVESDEFFVYPDLNPIVIRKQLGSKKIKSVFSGAGTIFNVATTKAEQESFCIDDKVIAELLECAYRLQYHYLHMMDIEWAIDGLDGQLYIVQARPIVVVD